MCHGSPSTTSSAAAFTLPLFTASIRSSIAIIGPLEVFTTSLTPSFDFCDVFFVDQMICTVHQRCTQGNYIKILQGADPVLLFLLLLLLQLPLEEMDHTLRTEFKSFCKFSCCCLAIFPNPSRKSEGSVWIVCCGFNPSFVSHFPSFTRLQL